MMTRVSGDDEPCNGSDPHSRARGLGRRAPGGSPLIGCQWLPGVRISDHVRPRPLDQLLHSALGFIEYGRASTPHSTFRYRAVLWLCFAVRWVFFAPPLV